MKAGYFFLTSLVLLFCTAIMLVFIEGSAPTAWANGLHNHGLDIFFRYFTMAGEWPVITVILAMALYMHAKRGLWMAACFGLEAIINNILKKIINAPRPIQELGESLHRVPGVDIHHWQSFPSGHTAAAFTAFGLLAHMLRKPWQQMLCVLASATVGFSRMYLGQHYLRDLAGGIAVALIVLLIYETGEPMIVSRMSKKP